ncbi:unnamed protein product [Amoebophrya sp. A120]|nr:unnamed protein product [Amoebophrya sp. A120]|eukprot:GSA120T00006421001.1
MAAKDNMILFELRLEELLKSYTFDMTVRDQMEMGQRKIFAEAETLWSSLLDKSDLEAETLLSIAEIDPKAHAASGTAVPVDVESRPASSTVISEHQRRLFFPRPSDMKFYAKALRKKTASGQPAHVWRLKLLTVFYSIHHGTKELLQSFVESRGLLPIVEFMGYTKNRHVQSQAVEIFQHALTLPTFASVALELQQIQTLEFSERKQKGAEGDTEGRGDENELEPITQAKGRGVLLNHPWWPLVQEFLFSGQPEHSNFFHHMHEMLLDTQDVFPHSRVTACKLLGLVLQVICQPLLRRSKTMLSSSSSASRVVRIPSELYGRILALHESGELPPDDMEVVLELLNFLNDYDFDAERAAAAREDAEDVAALQRIYGKKTCTSVEKGADGGLQKATYGPPLAASAATSSPASGAAATEDFISSQLDLVDADVGVSKNKTGASSAETGAHNGSGAMPAVADVELASGESPSSVAQRKDTKRHMENVEKAFQDMQFHLGFYKKMGNEAFKKQNFPGSIACYEAAVDDAGAGSTSFALLQGYYKACGLLPDADQDQVEKAESVFLKELDRRAGADRELHADLSRIENNLAMSFWKTSRTAESALHAKRACALDPTFAKAFYRHAEAAFALNDMETAEAAIFEATRLEPKDKTIIELKKKIVLANPN